MWKLLACLLFVVVAVSAQSIQFAPASFTQTEGSNALTVGVESPWIIVTAPVSPQNTVTITIGSSEDATANPSSLVLTATNPTKYFRITCLNTQGSNFNVTLDKNDDDDQFSDVPAAFYFDCKKRTITFTAPTDFPYTSEHSEPIAMVVSNPYNSELRLTATPNDASVSVTPNPVVIPAGARGATFTWMASGYVDSSDSTIDWRIDGDNNGWYAPIVNSTVFGSQYRELVYADTSYISGGVLASQDGSNGLYVYTRQLSNQSFTITPWAVGTIFTPSSQQISGSTQGIWFTFNSTYTGSATKTVYFYASGSYDNYYNTSLDGLVAQTTIKIAKRKVFVDITQQVFVGNYTYMTVSIPTPTPSSLTVTFLGTHVWINQSTVTFTKNTTSFLVALRADNLGTATIQYALSGADSDAYESVDDLTIATPITVGVIMGSFVGIDKWYLPPLWVGSQSEKLPIRASVSPIKSVTLTPTAPNLIFSPRSLTFRNGSEQQYFTITPMYSNVHAVSGYTTGIDWLVSGDDQSIFDPPSSVTVTVRPRAFQMKWSAHLRTQDIDGPVAQNAQTHTETDRYLHKTYKVWATVNYVGDKEQVSVTPVNPYFSFSPKVLFFDAKHTRIEFEATVTGIDPNPYTSIYYMIGGQDGGLYTPVSADNVVTALRPLKIAAAVISPDERQSKGVYITSHPQYTYYSTATCAKDTQCIPHPVSAYTFNSGILAAGTTHVHSFLVRSFALPDGDLTIIPHSPHVTFSPSKIQFKKGHSTKRIDYLNYDGITIDQTYYFNLTGVYLEANFTAHAQAAGTHDVWFELQGSDADYYYRPPHTQMNFRLVMRPSTEPYKVSSSSFLFPSFVVVALMAAFALVM